MEGLATPSGGSTLFRRQSITDEVTVPVSQSTPISGLTQAQILSPSMPVARLEAEEVGLPDSPDVRVLCPVPPSVQDESDCEYDSDGNIHPPFDLDIEEGPPNFEEEEVTAQEKTGIENGKSTLVVEKIDKMMVSELKDHLRERNLSLTGRKAVLVERLKMAVVSGAPIIGNMPQEEKENMGGQGFSSLARWELLEPEDAIVSEEGLARAPTVPANEALCMGAPKRNYEHRFDRPLFQHEVLLPKRDSMGRIMRTMDGKVRYENKKTDETVPNIQAIHDAGLDCDSHPALWFDLFMPREKKRQEHPDVVTLADFTTWTNMKAAMENAGRGGVLYPEFKNFTIIELQQHLGLYILNGLCPSPQVSLKFQHPIDNPVNGSLLVHDSFQNNPQRRHRHFKRFFAATNPLVPLPCRKTSPNHKVQKFLKHAIKKSKTFMFIGRCISGDEQTIGSLSIFQFSLCFIHLLILFHSFFYFRMSRKAPRHSENHVQKGG